LYWCREKIPSEEEFWQALSQIEGKTAKSSHDFRKTYHIKPTYNTHTNSRCLKILGNLRPQIQKKGEKFLRTKFVNQTDEGKTTASKEKIHHKAEVEKMSGISESFKEILVSTSITSFLMTIIWG
jgi:hypothetical protein